MDFNSTEMIEKLRKSLHDIPDERKRLERIWREYRDQVQAKIPKLCNEKNASAAEALKNEGNRLYSSKKYREALIFYNQALCKAPKDSPLHGILYANRSAVYLVTNRPLECLENIDLALEHGYPKEKRDKMEERRAKCAEMINVMSDDELKPKPKPIQKPALSHPAHPKFPFLSNAVDIVLEPNVGPQLVVKQNLQVGDTFFVDSYNFRILDSIQTWNRFSCCGFCLFPDFLSLIPCDRCANVLFCKKCLPKFKQIHRLECCVMNAERFKPLYIRALVQILDLYKYDFEKLKQDIANCQSNPGSILEGDYVNDLERQVVRWIFPRWKQLDLTEFIEKSIDISSFLNQLLLNPSFKALVTSFDMEITLLQTLFSLLLLTSIQTSNDKQCYFSFQPIQFQFLTKDERESNARYYTSDHLKFTYCLRPMKLGSMIRLGIKIGETKDFIVKVGGDNFSSACKECMQGNDKPFYEMMRKCLPETYKMSKNLKIPNFQVVSEIVQVILGDQSMKLQTKKRLKRILNDYDRYFPCLELAVVMWFYMFNVDELYLDVNHVNIINMVFDEVYPGLKLNNIINRSMK